ncbi:uncharacterized protein LOC134249489 [Saccostrea cucullata]|uniref:uncharacterized protein LOC134249489 n=1 Tax=Saccostrea cuccullata TaxID=36930 RepID=UPI002ED2ADE0
MGNWKQMPTGQSERAVLPVDSCPMNLSKVEDASKRLNCSSGIDKFENTYHCLPLSDFSQLVELCYQTSYLVQKGNCMVLHSGYLNNQSCLHFTEGCPKTYYQSKRMFEFPDCIQINKRNRCYLADPRCPTLSSDFLSTTVTTTLNVSLSITTSTSHGDTSGDEDWIAIPVVLCVLVIILIVAGFVWKRKCYRFFFKEKSGGNFLFNYSL